MLAIEPVYSEAERKSSPGIAQVAAGALVSGKNILVVVAQVNVLPGIAAVGRFQHNDFFVGRASGEVASVRVIVGHGQVNCKSSDKSMPFMAEVHAPAALSIL